MVLMLNCLVNAHVDGILLLLICFSVSGDL